jgi:hypothetical protein
MTECRHPPQRPVVRRAAPAASSRADAACWNVEAAGAYNTLSDPGCPIGGFARKTGQPVGPGGQTTLPLDIPYHFCACHTKWAAVKCIALPRSRRHVRSSDRWLRLIRYTLGRIAGHDRAVHAHHEWWAQAAAVCGPTYTDETCNNKLQSIALACMPYSTVV